MIDANRVQEILFDCFFSESEIENGKPLVPYIAVEGLMRNFGFNPRKIEKHKPEIKSMLDQIEQLPEGISFLVFGKCKDSDNLWGEHVNYEQLIALGIASGYLFYLTPRNLWSVFPGGVPYIGYDMTGNQKIPLVEV